MSTGFFFRTILGLDKGAAPGCSPKGGAVESVLLE